MYEQTLLSLNPIHMNNEATLCKLFTQIHTKCSTLKYLNIVNHFQKESVIIIAPKGKE